MRSSTLIALALLAIAACGDGPEPPPVTPEATWQKPFTDGRPVIEGTIAEFRDQEPRPVPGVSVHLRLPYGAGRKGHKGLTTETEEHGYFAIDLEGTLTPRNDGPVELTFRKEGYVAVYHQLPSWKPGIGLSMKLVMERSGTLLGTVRDGDGAPIADAIVYAIRADCPGVRHLQEVLHAKSAADGSYRIEGLPEGVIDVAAKAPGYVTGFQTEVPVTREKEHEVAALVLNPGKTIAGRVVLRKSKEPVTGARVRVFRDPALKNIRYFGRPGAKNGGGATLVDKEGRFTVSGLPDGEWQVEAVTMGLAPVRPMATGVRGGTTDVELVFDRATTIFLRVFDGETGKSLPRFQLVIQNLSGPKGPDGRPIVVEEVDVRSPVGEYSFPAREDETYTVETAVEGYEIDRRTVGPLKGGPPTRVKIVLKRRE